MSEKAMTRIRALFAVLAVAAFVGVGAFAFERTVMTSSTISLISSAIGSSQESLNALTENRDRGVISSPKTVGSGPVGIIYGRGTLPLLFADRVDKIELLLTSGISQEIAAVNDFEPSWSPDGNTIVFISLRDGPKVTNFFTRNAAREIYTMNADGTDQRRLGGTFYGGESQPVFSPHDEPNRKIIYVADYSTFGGGPSGVFTMNTDGSNQTQIDTDICYADKDRRKSRPKWSGNSDFFPGLYGFDTPNYSPDGSFFIFGGGGDNGTNIFRMNSDGTNCTVLYEGQGSYAPTQARYSPDGTMIVLYHEETIFGSAHLGQTTRYLKIINANTGNLITQYEPTDLSGWPVWSPDGEKIAYFTGYTDPKTGDHYQSLGIRSIRVSDGLEDFVFLQGVPEGLRGMSWGTPGTLVRPLSMRINAPHPLVSGQSTTGTVYLSSPAPAGGATIILQALGVAGAITVPANVVVPEGETSGNFDIGSSTSTLYRSADVLATRPSPDFAQSIATVSLSPSRPDLRAVSFTAPPTANPATAFDVSWTVENIGPVTTGTNGGDDVVYFSLDNILDPSDGLPIRTVGNGALLPGTSRTRNSTASIPSNRIPSAGQYYLIFRTNPNETVNEGGQTGNNEIAVPIQVNLPDLVIENINAPATVEPGVPYSISWTVRNTGTAPTGSNTYRNYLYFSLDDIAGNEDDVQFVINSDFGSLAPGASFVQTFNATIPTVPARPTGPAFYYVKADVQNQIYEGTAGGPGESNNITFKPVQFEYNVPDLQVTSTSAPPEVETDTVFAFEWTTTNAGNKTAGTFSERVYFSTDNQVGGDVLLGTFPLTGGLAAGASVNRIQNVTIPTSAIPVTGNYYVYVQTDSGSNINEGENENNNTRFHLVNVRRTLRPDLTITNITSPPTVFFDQTIQVQWTVTNIGAGPTNVPQWKDTLYIGTSPTSISGATKLAEPSSISALNPGESYTASATVKIPRGLNGSYHFIVRTNSNSAVNEENTTNNLSSDPVQVNIPPLPDLVVETVQAPDEVFAGQGISINYTVRNIGTANAGTRRDRIYFSRDTTLNTSQDRLVFTSDVVSSPNAGAVQSFISRNRIGTSNPPQYRLATVPSNMEGLWYVFVVADYTNTVYEFTGENNNVNYDSEEPGSPLNVLVSPPDLVVPDQPVAPQTAASGTSIGVTFTVRNQGAFSASPFLYHAVYLSTDNTFDAATDTLLGSFRDPIFFGPGDEHPITVTGSLPNCLANGTYYLFAVADYNNRQFEFDPNFDAEANNASPPREIQLASTPPDLQVTNFSVPAINTPGQVVPLSWTVTNLGGPTNRNWTDRLFLRSTTPGISPQTLVSVPRTGGLPGGGSYTEARSISLPAFMEGEYFLSVTTDVSNTVPECGSAENNNTAQSSNFSVDNNLPDLVIDSINAPTTAMVGDSFNVQWVGRNANQAMPGNSPNWRDSVYLSTNNTLSNGDLLIGSSINSTLLAGGATYQQQAPVQIGNVAAGNYYLLVVADSNRNIYEGTSNSTQEGNNVRAFGPITLTSPAVDLQASNVSVSLPHHSGTFREVSWTVTNIGTSPTLATQWTDYVILSRDAVYDPSDVTLGYRQRTGGLAGGESYSQTGTFLIPSGLTGDYTVFVITDKTAKVVENNDANNVSPPVTINLTLPPPADLSITNITPPASVNLGGTGTFQWTVQNTGANPVVGQWRDTVYLSRDTFWDASDVLVGIKDLSSQTTPVPAGGGTYMTSLTALVPPVEEGVYYVIVRTDSQNRIRETNEGDNVTTSISTTTVNITELTLNTPLNTTLGNGAQQFFKYVTDPDETLIFSLTTNFPNRANEAFTKFGTIVSRANYDLQGSRPGEGNQENVIEETQDGSYYSMVRTDLIPQSFAKNFDPSPAKPKEANIGIGVPVPPQNITVNARILPFSIRKVSPEIAGNGGYTTMLVEGAKFQEGATLKLVSPGKPDIIPGKLRVFPTKVIAIFDLKGRSAGEYDIVVTNPNNEVATLENGFEIVNGGGAAEPRVTINGPGSSRGGRMRYTVSVANDGLNDLLLVPIIITMPSAYSYELDRSNDIGDVSEFLPPDAVPSQLPVHYDEDGTRVIALFTPVLGSRRTVNVNIDITLPFGFSGFEITAFTMPPLEEWLTLAEEQQTEVLRRQIANFGSGTAAECSEKLKRCLWEVLRSVIFAAISEALPSGCVGAAWGLALGVSDLAIGMIVKGSGANIYDAVGAISGLMASALGSLANECGLQQIPWVKAISLALFTFKAMYDLWDCYRQRRDCLPPPPTVKTVTRPFSLDPNDKVGPEGYGPERWVPVGQPLEYRINFENVSSATAPAQLVRITDTLPPSLDLRTVRLKEIGFKQYRIVIPGNQSFYQGSLQLGEDLNNLRADILAGVDLVNDRIFWNLQAVDPLTSEPPLDPFAGLLPPNNEDRDGEGYVIFTVEAKQSFPSGTEIANIASIIFDQNEPIITEPTSHLLDSVVPISQINPLPATSAVPDIDLTWTGSDDADGSGTAGYSMYYSIDNGPYRLYTTVRDETVVPFAGLWGKSYRFYSIGRDNAGNEERAPTQPDATIRIFGGDTEGDVDPRPNGNDGMLSASDTDQVRRFVTGLDSDFTYNEFQRADVSPRDGGGNGTLSVADVMQLRRFVSGLDPKADAAGPNESSGAPPALIEGKNAAMMPRQIRAENMFRIGNQIWVGVRLEAQGDETGIGFGLEFDTSVLSNPVVSLGPDATGSVLTVNSSDIVNGKLGVLLDRAPASPFAAGNKQILTIVFDVAMTAGSSTLLTFGSDPIVAEVVDGTAASLLTTFSPSTIQLVVPTSAGVSVSGTVYRPNGNPLRSARVSITDTKSVNRTMTTNGFGLFKFEGIPAGGSYVITVRANGLVFAPRLINVGEDVSGLVFTPDP